MSGIFFHASMPHYDLDKGVVGASYGGGHQSIIIQDSCLDRESENQKKIEFQILTRLSQISTYKAHLVYSEVM